MAPRPDALLADVRLQRELRAAAAHDEVVHGKGSLLAKMPGDDWQKFANLRAYSTASCGAHPGKKLLFMGCEFAPWTEWNADASLPWRCSTTPRTPACSAWCATSTTCCAAIRRCTPGHRAHTSAGSPRRRGALRCWSSSVARATAAVVVLCNFTPVVRHALAHRRARRHLGRAHQHRRRRGGSGTNGTPDRVGNNEASRWSPACRRWRGAVARNETPDAWPKRSQR